MIHIEDKRKYITDKYIDNETRKDDHTSYNGHHIQKGKRVNQPFSTFYPDPKMIKKNSDDN